MKNKIKKRRCAKNKIIALVVLLTAIAGSLYWFYPAFPEKNDQNAADMPENIFAKNKDAVRVGYFHGGRVNMIYRTYINDYFDKENLNVKLYTKDLKGAEIFEIPKDHEEVEEISKSMLNFGKMKGTEIVDEMMKGNFDGGTIGESSFIASINKDLPIMAVAMLGYDPVAGKAIVMRSDVKINSLEDFKGKTLISRRAGPGDAIFLREFIESLGLTPNDLKIIDDVDEDDSVAWLKEKKIDGGLYHLTTVRHLVNDGIAYVYQPMDWMDSKLSHAVLVFNKSYLNDHPEEVQKFVNAYVKRIKYEKSLAQEQRDASWDKGLMMEGEFDGMKIPNYDLPPKAREDLLEEIQRLLLKYGEIKENANIADFIDDSFVEKAMEEIK